MGKPIYSAEFDEGYDAFKRGALGHSAVPYDLDEPERRQHWWWGYHTAEWEMQEPK